MTRPGVAGSLRVGPDYAELKEEAPDLRALSDRVGALEHQIQEVLRRLERLEGQSKPPDARIEGGREVPRSGANAQ